MKSGLGPLFERLRSAQWNWDLPSTERLVAGIAGDPVERVASRTSYRLQGFEDLSLYWEGNRAEFLEVTLEVFRDPHLLEVGDYENKVDEYFRKYQSVVAEATRALGSPLFDDGSAAAGFPKDQDAVWLALWAINGARLMVEQKHEDKELPFRLCVIVAPLAPL